MVRRRLVLMLGPSLLVLGLLTRPQTFPSKGNSEAAKACQDGCYLSWTDTAGNALNNTGACTSYVANGGTLVPIEEEQFFAMDY